MGVMKSIGNAIKSVFPSAEGNFYPLMNTNYSVSNLTRTDYLKLYTSWQYVAVSTIANSVAELEKSFTRTSDDDKQIHHKHFDLITFDLLIQIVSSLQLTGSCYLYKNMIGTVVDSLEILRVDLVEPIEDSQGFLKGYRYNGRKNQMLFDKDDVIAIDLFSPLKSYPYSAKGVSPMQAVAIQAEMDATANRWNWSFFKNGASAGDIFSTDNPIKEEQKERFLSKWKSEFQGVNNSHKAALLDNGLKYNRVGLTQRELDFVETRRFTRDEVFAVFKVPKSIVGVSDDVNRASAVVAENTFYRVCIRPLAIMLQEVFNRELFKGIGYFQFLNIVPADNEQLALDFNSGAITINEYRKERGWKPLKDGDILKLPFMVDIENQFKLENQKKHNQEIQEIFLKNIKGTKENLEEREKFGQKKWEMKVQRTDKYEIKYEEEVRRLFEEQKNSIVSQILEQKAVSNPKFDRLLNTAKRVLALTPLYKEVFQNEGNEAFLLLGLSETFNPGEAPSTKWIRKNIELVARSVDKITKEKVFDLIEKMNNEGKGAEEIARAIDIQFQEFSRTRARTIARTEITRASTEAEIQAFEQSGVVSGKEWYVALDERTCPDCMSMHGKTIGLRENYIEKGDEYRGVVYDYSDVAGPSLHPNCRCTLLPVVK